MARTNEEIISLYDRIMTFCNRLNKKLDEYGEFPSSFHEQPVPQPPYGHPPLVEAGFHPPHAQPPDPPDWQRPYWPYDWATHVAHQRERYLPPLPYQPEPPSDLPAPFVDCRTTALLQHQSPNFCAQPQPAYLHPDHSMPRHQICWDSPDQRQALAATPTRYTIAGYQDLLPEYHQPSRGPNQCGHTSPQPHQSTSWDLPGQPSQHGILAYDWQPPTDWPPPPPPPTYEPDPYCQLHSSLPKQPLQQHTFWQQNHQHQEPVLDQPPPSRWPSCWHPPSHHRSAAPLPAAPAPAAIFLPCGPDIRYGSIESLADDSDDHESVQSRQIIYDEIVTDQLLNQDPIGDEEVLTEVEEFLQVTNEKQFDLDLSNVIAQKDVIHSSVDVRGSIYGSNDDIDDSCNVVFARQKPTHDVEHDRVDSTMLGNWFDSLKEDIHGSSEDVKKVIACGYVDFHVGNVASIVHHSTKLDAFVKRKENFRLKLIHSRGKDISNESIPMVVANACQLSDLSAKQSSCSFDPGGSISFEVLLVTHVVVSWLPP